MNSDVHLKFVDYTNMKIIADQGIIQELSDKFTFEVPGAKFSPRVKMKIWDGKIALINRLSSTTLMGLASRIKKFCDERDYSFSYDEEFVYDVVDERQFNEFISSLNLPFEPHDYQVESVKKCISSHRRTLVSPTSSGKSLIIYLLTQWYKKKFLLIVPSIGLVGQMRDDFEEYGFDGVISTSLGGLDKSNDIECDGVITTWQSLDNGKTKMPKSWYEQFEVVMFDEVHLAKAMCAKRIMEGLKHCKYKFGTTGTLQNDNLSQFTIEGLFGAQFKSISTSEMIERGFATNLKIKCIILNHNKEECKLIKNADYNQEIDFIVNHRKRNNFIKKLALSLSGNKLLFFRLTDHGKILKDLLDSESTYYIDGGIKGEQRQDIRSIIEQEDNATLIASLGTTSTGVSIKKLKYMISASPSKSKIKVLQSIGRMLRKHEDKDIAYLYDIVDNFSYGKKKNFTLKHFEERLKIYDSENFDYEIIEYNL